MATLSELTTHRLRSFGAALFGALIAWSASAEFAQALTKDQAINQCRERVGKPRVQACVRNMMQTRGGSPQQYIESCRAPVIPLVQACVQQALIKANSRPDIPLPLNSGKPSQKQEEVSPELALKSGFVPPPRTITDVTAVLDSEKPDPEKLASRKADAEKEPAKGLSKADLAEFYLARANAKSQLGFTTPAIDDAKLALSSGMGSAEARLLNRARQFLALQYLAIGDTKSATKALEDYIRASDVPGAKGSLFNAYRLMITALVQTGDIQKIEAYVRRNEALLKEARTSPHPGWRQSYPQFGRSWEADVEASRGVLFETRGQIQEAEAAYKKSEQWVRASADDMLKSRFAPSATQLFYGADLMLLSVGRMKVRQARLPEAEADARKALLSRLKDQGKYHPQTTRFVTGLAANLVEQGRYAEAEKLVRTAIDIQRTLGIPDDSQITANAMAQLASILNYQRKPKEAAEIYDELDKTTAGWDFKRRENLALNGSRITSLYASGQIEAGVKLAQDLLSRQIARSGENTVAAAITRGNLAVGYLRLGQDENAAREFKAAIPVLMAASREITADEGNSGVGALTGRLQIVVEAYIGMLARNRDNLRADIAQETFALADAIRGQSVQNALGASSARSAAKDPVLAELVRKEQDASKRIAAQLGALNNALASDERDEKAIKATNAALEKSRTDREKVRQEIDRRFPDYANLINPKPPTIEQIRATLNDGESLLSFYFGRQLSFVWAVPKDGPLAFASIRAAPGDLESKIRKLRESLEPNAAMISEIPQFDLKLGHELYSLLLKPVEAGWKQAKSLIVVTNGALGLLPLSLLPTEAAEINPNEEPLFESYRRVPWLARTHAVTMVPSSAALLTLRQLPAGSPNRGELMAFGDPLFSTEQAEEAAKPIQVADASNAIAAADASNVMRGLPLKRRNSPKLEGVDSAELGLLPRLPDTADELKSIALALQADPSKVLNLGKEANEKIVKTMDLSGFKVLAFATHGLVPGELNGLTQPALALSAPAVSGSEGDGLLTMEEILSLKLDADWVVLSACNTGAGSGAGAEAASGLGRAFFYAGTRALLVTNWSVHSQSARELVTDLFKRQADDTKLTRGEALRQAMMAMVDGAGYTDASGKTEFAYAHPLFWAPYTIIGDGGKR